MKLLKTVVACGLFVLSLAACSQTPARNERLEQLRSVIGADPLSEAAAARLAKEKAELDALASQLRARADKKENAHLDWQVGECQRLRHLFDAPGAWEEAERHLQLALARKPDMAATHLSLGQLYLTGGTDDAPRAERHLVRALENSHGDPLPQAHRGLFLAYYFQGEWKKAVDEADRFLAMAGDDADVRKMRAMAETNLAEPKEKQK